MNNGIWTKDIERLSQLQTHPHTKEKKVHGITNYKISEILKLSNI